MDLILLEPGDPELVLGKKKSDWTTADSQIGEQWRDNALFKEIGPCLQLVSMYQGMKQQMTTDVANSARTSGRPVITEFTCVKHTDRTSVKLYDLCLRAKPLGSGDKQPTKLHFARRASDQTVNLMTIWLRDAMVSEIQLQTEPGDAPTERFKLNFTEILWFYDTQLVGTDPADKSSAGWSLARNRPITAFTS
jgi:type VI secretion system secreted protein Hcp